MASDNIRYVSSYFKSIERANLWAWGASIVGDNKIISLQKEDTQVLPMED